LKNNDFRIIDTHCHAGLNWFEPVESLIFQMDNNGVDGAILIQHGGTFDNEYLFEVSRKFPNRFRLVCLVDPSAKDPVKKLENLAEKGASGIRMSPNSRFDNVDVNDFWSICGKMGLAVSVIGSLEDFSSENFKKIIDQNPKTNIVLEHLAGFSNYKVQKGELMSFHELIIQYKKVLEYGSRDNVYMKIPGLGELEPRPGILSPSFSLIDSRGIVDMTLELFGSEKLMWGSDFPPVSNREGYTNALNWIKESKTFSKKEKQDLFSKVPQKVFGI
jgi:L-fuconolactonase